MAGGAAKRAGEPNTVIPQERLDICVGPFAILTVQVREWEWLGLGMPGRHPGADQIGCSNLTFIEFYLVLTCLIN